MGLFEWKTCDPQKLQANIKEWNFAADSKQEWHPWKLCTVALKHNMALGFMSGLKAF